MSHIVPLWVLSFFIWWYKQSPLSNSCGRSICLDVAVVTAACLTGPRGSLDCFLFKLISRQNHFGPGSCVSALLLSRNEAKWKIIFKSNLFPGVTLLCWGWQRSKCFASPLHSDKHEATEPLWRTVPFHSHPRLAPLFSLFGTILWPAWL